jgi:iron complex transport system substrate-binding protein
VEIGQNPLYTVGKGTLIDELVTLAGGTNVVTQPGYVAYSAEQLIAADPQVYLATRGSMSDPSSLKSRAGFDKLAAVKTGRVIILDDNLVSRPGPRLVEGLKQIAEGLHPDSFAGK